MSGLRRRSVAATRRCGNGHIQTGDRFTCSVCGDVTGACCPQGHPAPLGADVCATCGQTIHRAYPPAPRWIQRLQAWLAGSYYLSSDATRQD